MVFKKGLEKTGRFTIALKDNSLPVVAFSLKDHTKHNEFDVSKMVRNFRRTLLACTMPTDAHDVAVLRVVVQEDFSETLAQRLVLDITRVLNELDQLPPKISNGHS